MRIVLDTNVLVSGLLSPYGPPGEIVRLVSSGAIVLCVDARMLSEYEAVLHRPRFRFDPDDIAALLDYIEDASELVAPHPLPVRLPDVDDEAFLETAVTASADCLVTGNAIHFPREARAGILVVSPADFMERYRSGKRT